MAEEIDFENRHFETSHVTLTLPSYDLESHIVVNVSSTLTNSTIWFVAALCLIVDVRTDGRKYIRTFLPGLLGHLGGDDLKMCKIRKQCFLVHVRHHHVYTQLVTTSMSSPSLLDM